MTDTHRMKLREPWQREASGKSTKFCRAFHRPTNLEPQERVFVAIREAKASGAVAVNGQTLSAMSCGDDVAVEVTELLGDRNQIEIAVDHCVDATALPFAEAAIEIRA